MHTATHCGCDTIHENSNNVKHRTYVCIYIPTTLPDRHGDYMILQLWTLKTKEIEIIAMLDDHYINNNI